MRAHALLLTVLLTACGQADVAAPPPAAPAPQLPTTADWMPPPQGRLEVRELERVLIEPEVMRLQLEVKNASTRQILQWDGEAQYVSEGHRVVGGSVFMGGPMAPGATQQVTLYVPVSEPEDIHWNQYQLRRVEVLDSDRPVNALDRFAIIFDSKANPITVPAAG